jgi:hypothetical protein
MACTAADATSARSGPGHFATSKEAIPPVTPGRWHPTRRPHRRSAFPGRRARVLPPVGLESPTSGKWRRRKKAVRAATRSRHRTAPPWEYAASGPISTPSLHGSRCWHADRWWLRSAVCTSCPATRHSDSPRRLAEDIGISPGNLWKSAPILPLPARGEFGSTLTKIPSLTLPITPIVTLSDHRREAVPARFARACRRPARRRRASGQVNGPRRRCLHRQPAAPGTHAPANNT